jgi:hypothetical protein
MFMYNGAILLDGSIRCTCHHGSNDMHNIASSKMEVMGLLDFVGEEKNHTQAIVPLLLPNL